MKIVKSRLKLHSSFLEKKEQKDYHILLLPIKPLTASTLHSPQCPLTSFHNALYDYLFVQRVQENHHDYAVAEWGPIVIE